MLFLAVQTAIIIDAFNMENKIVIYVTFLKIDVAYFILYAYITLVLWNTRCAAQIQKEAYHVYD